MSQLRDRMIRDMQLRRLSNNTQRVYTHAVPALAKRYMKSPDQLSDQQVQERSVNRRAYRRDYVTPRRNGHTASP